MGTAFLEGSWWCWCHRLGWLRRHDPGATQLKAGIPQTDMLLRPAAIRNSRLAPTFQMKPSNFPFPSPELLPGNLPCPLLWLEKIKCALYRKGRAFLSPLLLHVHPHVTAHTGTLPGPLTQSCLNSVSLIPTQWRRKWQPTPVFLPGESQGQQSLVAYRLWGRTE